MPNLNHKKAVLIPSALVCVLLAGGFIIRREDNLAPVTVSRSYHSDDFESIELQGACDILPNSVTCWDADGKPDSDLGEQVKAFYIVNNSNELHYKFGRKNRAVVFKVSDSPARRGASFRQIDQPGFPIGQISSPTADRQPTLEWFAVDTDPDKTATSMTFELDLPMGTGAIPLRVGASGKVGAATLEIVSIKPAPDRQSPWMGPGKKQKAWTVSLKVTGTPGTAMPNMNGRAVDSKGNTIMWVDSSGIPLPERAAFGGGSTPFNNRFDAGVQVTGGAGSANQELFLGVDPSKIASLSFNPIGQRKVTVTDIPLDPK